MSRYPSPLTTTAEPPPRRVCTLATCGVTCRATATTVREYASRATVSASSASSAPRCTTGSLPDRPARPSRRRRRASPRSHPRPRRPPSRSHDYTAIPPASAESRSRPSCSPQAQSACRRRDVDSARAIRHPRSAKRPVPDLERVRPYGAAHPDGSGDRMRFTAMAIQPVQLPGRCPLPDARHLFGRWSRWSGRKLRDGGAGWRVGRRSLVGGPVRRSPLRSRGIRVGRGRVGG